MTARPADQTPPAFCGAVRGLVCLPVVLFLAAPAFSVQVVDLAAWGEMGAYCAKDGTLYASFRDEDDFSLFCGIVAIDLGMGESLWIYDTTLEEASARGSAWWIRLDEGRLYALVNGLGVVCLDAGTGEEFFRWEPEDHIIAPFVLEDGVLYAASTTEVVALDAATGELLWRWEDTCGEIGMWPTIINIYFHEDRLYIGCILPGIFCFDALTGELLWESEGVMDSGGGGYAHTEQVSDSLVFVSTSSEELSLLDAGTGWAIGCLQYAEYMAGDSRGIYAYHWDEDAVLELDPLTGELTGRLLPESGMGLWDSHAIMTPDALCMGTGDGWLILVPRTEDPGSQMIRTWHLSDERLTLAADRDRAMALSSEGNLLMVDLRTLEAEYMETDLEAKGALTLLHGLACFPTPGGLALIEYDDPLWQEDTP